MSNCKNMANCKIYSNTQWIERLVNSVYERSTYDMRTHHVCIITKGKKLVAVGINNSRTCVDGKTVGSVHAEHSAIRNFLRFQNEKWGRTRWRKGKDL